MVLVLFYSYMANYGEKLLEAKLGETNSAYKKQTGLMVSEDRQSIERCKSYKFYFAGGYKSFNLVSVPR